MEPLHYLNLYKPCPEVLRSVFLQGSESPHEGLQIGHSGTASKEGTCDCLQTLPTVLWVLLGKGVCGGSGGGLIKTQKSISQRSRGPVCADQGGRPKRDFPGSTSCLEMNRKMLRWEKADAGVWRHRVSVVGEAEGLEGGGCRGSWGGGRLQRVLAGEGAEGPLREGSGQEVPR